MSDHGRPFSVHNPWRLYGAGLVAFMLVMGLTIGFLWLPSVQEKPIFGDRLKKATGLWASICRGLGWTGDKEATTTAAPPAQWATDVSWNPPTLQRALSGNAAHGEFIALNCAACHGEQGSGTAQTWIPKLGGQDTLTIYKQLADYRSGRRQWGVMNAVATALTEQDSADVAAYFSKQKQSKPTDADAQASHQDAAQFVQVQRLVFQGDPMRHIPACATCHGPRARMTAAPLLTGQHPDYIERQLGSFAQSSRTNDAHQQMRIIATQLSPEEIHALAEFITQGSGAGDTLR